MTLTASKRSPTQISALAYCGKSDILYDPPGKLSQISSKYYMGVIEVQNKGIRSGFAVFSLLQDKNNDNDDIDDIDISVDPPYVILKPNEKQLFKFISSSKDFKVVLHSGDEILRQIKAGLEPNSFFDFHFDDYVIRDEISKIPIYEFDIPSFNSIFIQYLNQKEIAFGDNTDDNSSQSFNNQNQSNISYSQLNQENIIDFGDIILQKSEQSNQYSKSLIIKCDEEQGRFLVKTKSLNLKVPQFLVKKFGIPLRLPVSLIIGKNTPSGEYEEPVEIQKTYLKGNVQAFVTIFVKYQINGYVSQDTIDFGHCIVERKSRAKVRISNHGHSLKNIQISAESPLTSQIKEIQIPPKESVFIWIHATPKEEGPFEASVIIFDKSNQKSIKMRGIGLAFMQ